MPQASGRGNADRKRWPHARGEGTNLTRDFNIIQKRAQSQGAYTFSRDKRILFAGTGPQGKVYAIGRDGKANLYADTEEEHVLSLGMDERGKLLAGTSPRAKLLKLDGPGRMENDL